MKLLIATGLYPPDIGGPATYTVFLEKHLAAHGVECEVVSFRDVRKYPKIVRHLMYLWRVMWRARHADMLYALDTVSVGLPVRIASMVTRTPYLLRVPGDYAWEQGSVRYGITETLDAYRTHTHHSWQVRVLAWIQKKVAQSAHHCIAPSEYMKEVVCGWGVPREKVTRIYSALKKISCPESKDALRKKYGYENFVVSSAGRLVPWKGMSALVESVCKLRNEGVPISLEIIGDGVCRDDLEKQIEKNDAGTYVALRGVLGREEMAERITASDVFVLNTAYEGFSHQLIEAMSLGTPVVTTNVGGNVELITHEETGIFVPYNDVPEIAQALRVLYRDATFRQVLAKRAETSVERFHEDVLIQEFVTLLHTLWKF